MSSNMFNALFDEMVDVFETILYSDNTRTTLKYTNHTNSRGYPTTYAYGNTTHSYTVYSNQYDTRGYPRSY